MQRNCHGPIEPDQATTQSALSRCFVDGDAAAKRGDRRRRREALGISFIIESLVLVALVVAPLMTSIAQPALSRLTPPMPIIGANWKAHSTHRGPVTRPSQLTLFDPVRDLRPEVPRPVDNSNQVEPPDVDSGMIIPGGEISDDFSTHNTAPTRWPVEPPVETRTTNEKRIVRVSGPVEQAQLLSRIEPRYPPLAIQTRTQGTVLLHAIISVDGRITALEVVTGPPLLVEAALDAVRQWRYRPTLLNGQAVEVETSITVIFRMGP